MEYEKTQFKEKEPILLIYIYFARIFKIPNVWLQTYKK